MIIKKFIAEKVHGFRNYDINFHDDISFLIGDNGSGKTTILKLIQAIFTLDLEILATHEFKTLILLIEDGSRNPLDIRLESNGGLISIFFDGASESTQFEILRKEDFDNLSRDRIKERFSEQRLQLLKIMPDKGKRFYEKPNPIFLGLNRLDQANDSVAPEIRRNINYRYRGISELGTSGIDACRAIIGEAYRRYRRHSDQAYESITKGIIDSSFDYLQFSATGDLLGHPEEHIKELNDLLDRWGELEEIVSRITRGNPPKEMLTFHGSLKKLVDEIGPRNANQGFPLEVLMNLLQTKRLNDILRLQDLTTTKLDKFLAPINQFQEILQHFFGDSKQVKVDRVGQLKVYQNSMELPLENLSSGEKQLLILITHAIFPAHAAGVFIVDEPEISMHLKWQRELIENLTIFNKNNQYIFATHSPEIIGINKNRCISINSN